jgi:hypothetical protein
MPLRKPPLNLRIFIKACESKKLHKFLSAEKVSNLKKAKAEKGGNSAG